MERLLQRLEGDTRQHRRLCADQQRLASAARVIVQRNRELRFQLRALRARLRLAPPARFREVLHYIEIAESLARLPERFAVLQLAEAMVRAYEDLGALELGGASGPGGDAGAAGPNRERTVKHT